MTNSSEERAPFAFNTEDMKGEQSDSILITRAKDAVIIQIRRMIDRDPESIVQALREFLNKTQE